MTEALRSEAQINPDLAPAQANLFSSIAATPNRDLSSRLTEIKDLPFWRKTAIAGTALVAGLTAAGAIPKPAEANGFLKTGGSQSVECIDDGAVYALKKEPAIAVVDSNTNVASVAQPQTSELAAADQELQDIEIAVLSDGSRILLAPAKPCPTETPEATPELRVVGDLIDSRIRKVSIKKLNTSIERAYDSNQHPEITDKVLKEKWLKDLLKMCQTMEERGVCSSLVDSTFAIHMMTGDPNFYTLSSDLYNFIIGLWGKEYKNAMDKQLKESYPPGYIPKIDEW